LHGLFSWRPLIQNPFQIFLEIISSCYKYEGKKGVVFFSGNGPGFLMDKA